MNMNLTCPECGHQFEIEESQQAQEKQAAALEVQKKEAEKNTQKKLEEQRKEFKQEQDAIKQEQDAKVEAAVKKQLKEELKESKEILEEELKESTKRLKQEAIDEAEKNTQKKLEEQRKEFKQEQDAIKQEQDAKVEAAVKKQLKEELKESKAVVQQQIFNIKEEADRKLRAEIKKEKSENTLEKERMLKRIQDLETSAKRDQRVELKGEAAEERLKEDLRKRFPQDTIKDIPKGKKGADLELYITLGNGNSIGMILIERKSTKNFSQTWIKKFEKDMEASQAIFGVIVSDVMPKLHEDKGYFGVSSKISVMRHDSAVDGIEILRKGLIENHRNKVIEEGSKDIELTANVFAFITGKGKEHLEKIKTTLEEKKKLLDEKDKDHRRIMKKEWKNLSDQAEAFNKLGSGLKESSQEKVILLNETIEITDQTN